MPQMMPMLWINFLILMMMIILMLSMNIYFSNFIKLKKNYFKMFYNWKNWQW